MIVIPFMKLHGAENDFLLTWGDDLTKDDVTKCDAPDSDLPEIARRICARTTGIGADGWMQVWRSEGELQTRLFNSDGSEPEMSGNGTRCAAAFGLFHRAVLPPDISLGTAAGTKQLHLISRHGQHFLFEMNMGLPSIEECSTTIHLEGHDFDATILNVGNPQCSIFVENLPNDWRAAAAAAERHERFPQRTNVSFVRVLGRHAIEAVFYERGAGETRSSGTGAMGAAAAAILRDIVESPVEIRTPGGVFQLRWDESVYLTGPAEIIGEGRFFLDLGNH